MQVNDSFWLHQVAADTEPMVHVTADRRAEVVLFGTLQPLRGPFSLRWAGSSPSPRRGTSRVTVTQWAEGGEPVAVKVQCRPTWRRC